MLALQPESAQEKPAFANLSYLPTGNVKAFQCKLLSLSLLLVFDYGLPCTNLTVCDAS
jgi:hypothetical protein